MILETASLQGILWWTRKDGGLKRISELNLSYMALQYPLLFLYGEDGFHEKIPYHTNRGTQKTKRGYVSMKEYYAYVIQLRKCQAELPPPTTDPEGYKVVTEFILRGPCGKGAACTVEGKYSKKFPKPFYSETNLDEDGSNATKYLFKYLNKGPDRATFVILENVQKPSHGEPEKVVAIDEIKNYSNCRYLASYEAVWRLFSFDIHYSYPSVMKLNFHLEDQQAITLRDS
ncbi:hypothetical protein Tco_1224685 [Tanacetum coccineum]